MWLNLLRNNRIDAGTDVFRQFQGHWRGEWFQNWKTTTYDQTWFSSRKTSSGLVVQKVIIRKWDNRKERPASQTVAINTYNPKTDIILGAVDIAGPERTNSYAPHLGFCIDPSTFIWIACFKTDSETPSYSFYFENVTTIDHVKHYKIRGVGFNWIQKSKKIVNINWREGHYIQVNPRISAPYNPKYPNNSP